jgi:hypothetical protein
LRSVFSLMLEGIHVSPADEAQQATQSTDQGKRHEQLGSDFHVIEHVRLLRGGALRRIDARS